MMIISIKCIHFRKLLGAITIFFVLSCSPVNCTELILSNGSSLYKHLISNKEISDSTLLFGGQKWNYVVWPSYDKTNNLIYFEARNSDYGNENYIFSVDVSSLPYAVNKVTKGYFPAISLNGEFLSYYRHPNQLWIKHIKNHKEHLLVKDFARYQPVVWISNKHILYSDTENKLVKFDVTSGNIDLTGHSFTIPGALSPTREYVLCGGYYGNNIYSYNIKTNEISNIKYSSIFSLGSSFIFVNNTENFIYTRQTFSNIIKLNETKGLFLRTKDGEEQEILDTFSLFGGISVK